MLFPTAAFALFFVVAMTANWLLRPKHDLWRVVMVGLSFYFYAYWNWKFAGLLAGSIGGNWWAARSIATHRMTASGSATLTKTGQAVLRGSVAANLLMLAVFKYYGFFATSLTNTLRDVGIDGGPPLIEILLPVGISFFTFQAISYVIDVSRGEFDEPMQLLDVAFFLSFFPQLVAGPIVRATDMVDQISNRPDPRKVPAVEAFELIGRGLFKKVVISSFLASAIVDPVFAAPSEFSRWEVLLGVYGYAIQIYADFSGYTDIAIGCALLLGFRFPQNFDSPYRALTIQDFWRRWHMTLSSWLRDYLYFPLGGNRKGTLITYRNLWLTMVLGGLWHGAAWNFVLWGAIHGTALAVERYVSLVWRPLGMPPPLVYAARWFITFHVVCGAWIFFRASNTAAALEVFGQIFSGTPSRSGAAVGMVTLVIGASLIVQLTSVSVEPLRRRFAGLAFPTQGAILALTLTVIDVFGPEGVAPFIYFRF